MRSSERRGSPRPVASSSPSHTSAPLVPALGTQPPLLHPRHAAGHLLDGRPQRLPHSRHRVHDSLEVSGWEETITLLLLWWTTDQQRMALVLDHVVLIISVSKNYMKSRINKLYQNIRQVMFHSLLIQTQYWLDLACLPGPVFLPMDVTTVGWRLTEINPDKAAARWSLLQPDAQS